MDKDLKALLQSHQLKITSHRLVILDYLMTHETHPTAEKIHEDLPDISLATVYNTLEKLVESGLIIVINVNGTRRYDYYGEPHYHVINKTTGEIFNVDNFDFRPLINAAREASDLRITGFKVEVFGESKIKED